MVRKGIVALIVLLALAAGGFFLLRRQARSASSPPEPLRQARVVRGDLIITINASGNIAPAERRDLSFALPGTVADLPVEVGDAVKAGDLLAQLKTDELERAVAQAEINLRSARLKLEKLTAPPDETDLQEAEAAVHEAWAAYQTAKANLNLVQNSPEVGDAVRAARTKVDATFRVYQNLQARYDEGTFHDEDRLNEAHDAYLNALGELERAKQKADLELQKAQNEVTRTWDAYVSAKNKLERLKAGPDERDVEAAQLEVQAAELSLEKAKADLEAATLTAPFDGVVTAVNATEGEPVPAQKPILTLMDLSRLYLKVNVDELDVSSLREGQSVTVTVDALPDQPFTGVIEQIAPVGQSTSGIVAYQVTIRLDPTEAPIRVGMSATATIVVRELRDVLLVPNWAIRFDRETGRAYVSRQVGETLEEVPVELGERGEEVSQVLAGLAEGDIVAVGSTVERLQGFFGGRRGR